MALGKDVVVGDWVDRTPLIQDQIPSIWVQSVLYKTPVRAVDRAIEALARSAELAVMEDGVCKRVVLSYGDCSPARCLEEVDLEDLRAKYGWIVEIRYTWFGENLGSARGHNRLAKDCDLDFMLILNPDIVIAPRVIHHLLEPFTRTGTGMSEAKQLPLEHPKDYDPVTGDTSWAATACAMIPSEVFRHLGGFDEDTFFMYCDDVDFSWQVRLLGLRVVFQPNAVVLHDKRLSSTGGWDPTPAERYYSAEAALLLAHKWSRPDLVERILTDFDAHGDENQTRAARTYRTRVAQGDVPEPIDGDRRVGVFDNGYYAKHRFEL